MLQTTREAAHAASPHKAAPVETGPRRAITPRFAAALCTVALLVASASLILHSERYQDWRLLRLSLAELNDELKHQGESSRLLYFIGSRLDQRQRFAEADGYLRQGVGLDPDSERLRDEWARALLGSGQVKAAFGELTEFAGTHPRLAEAHRLLGKFYFTQNSMVRARDELRRAVALRPDDADALSYLAGAEDSLKDYPAALQAASRAVALRSNRAADHLIYATLCARMHRPSQQTESEFQTALRLESRNPVIHQEYARWLLDAARDPAGFRRAAEQARLAVTLGIHDADSSMVLGRALLYSGDRAGAVAPLTAAAEAAADDPAPAIALVGLHRALHQMDEARQWQQIALEREAAAAERRRLFEAVTVAPNDPVSKKRFARWMGLHGDADGCAHYYAMAMHKALDAPPVLAAASRDLAEGGHAGLALPLARRAVNVAYKSPDAHEALGNALLNLYEVKPAADEYNLAIRLDPPRSKLLIERLREFVRLHRSDRRLRGVTIAAIRTPAPSY